MNRRIRLSLASVLAAACLATAGGVAQADPDAVEQAKTNLERIRQQSSAIDHDLIEASDRVEQAEAKLATLSTDLKSQEGRVAKLSAEMGDVAALQMHQDPFNTTAQLLASESSDHFLTGLSTFENELDRSNASVQRLQLQQAKLTTLRQDTATTRENLKKDRDKKAALAKQFEEKENEAEGIYNRLSAEERERLRALEAEEQRKAAEAQAQEERRAAEASRSEEQREEPAPRSSESASATPSNSPKPSPDKKSGKKKGKDQGDAEPPVGGPGSSDRVERAIKAALAQVGKRYVWGTSGPNTFDCSGLTSYAYRQVGISLTRSSRGQYSSAGRRVPTSALKRGDLVFYYSPVSHVGIYLGGGKIVHASNPRTGIRTDSLHTMRLTGARRVIG